MTTKPTPAKKRPTVDLTDLTLAELDEAGRLMEQGAGRSTAFAFIGRHQLGMPDLTLEDAAKLTMRQVSIIESDPDEDDDDPSPAP